MTTASDNNTRNADSTGNTNGDLVVDVDRINKHFGSKHVVRDLSLQVRRGEIFGFLGPNGSGKTTSIRMMCGLLTPDSGHGTCLGFDIIKQSGEIKRRVGYMTQKFSYWDDLSIRENLDFVARIYEMKNRKEVVEQSLEKLGLSSRAKQLAGALSGGWKQRLALAASMLHQPELLLLDEPTAGVDPAARRDFWEELHRLAAEGISVLVSTHYMDEAERCHKLAYLSYGQLLVQGTAAEVAAGQGLTTWAIYSNRNGDIQENQLVGLSQQLHQQPGVDQLVVFGTSLHVCGKDAALLEQTLRRMTQGQNLRMELIDTSLEDVFIYMMNRSTDNFGEPP
ncbi:ABC transporter ATP-binding protein [Collimonas sp.]|jgi:ABC-2 type transport system ATP-binding protein|uniref:ABC transporter ATP-binding protein n=1 Tax=Collimonas sp. TaxID=1963772 RepID=UPI002CA1D671|nr:ABC transporter ATP-binding protein [Collimonas sp.]HWW07081.1 ABC transporter ATP-binding protein [Collimonas sp.]